MKKNLSTTINYGGAAYGSLLLVSPRRNDFVWIPGSKVIGIGLGETVTIADGVSATKYYQSRSGLSGACRVDYDLDYEAYPVGWTRPTCREQMPQEISIKGDNFWVYAEIQKWDESPNVLVMTNSHDVWKMNSYQLADILLGAEMPEPVETKKNEFITLDGSYIEIDLPKDRSLWRYTRHFSPRHSQYSLAVQGTDTFMEKYNVVFSNGRWAVCSKKWSESSIGNYLVLDRNVNMFCPTEYNSIEATVDSVPGWWVEDCFIAVQKGNEITLWARGESYEVGIAESLQDACNRFRKELFLPDFFSEENMATLMTGESTCVFKDVVEDDVVLMDVIEKLEDPDYDHLGWPTIHNKDEFI